MEIDKRICLICDGKMEHTEHSQGLQCVNGCLSYTTSFSHSVVIFVTLLFDYDKHNWKAAFIYPVPEEIDILKERIEYWKENDRYVMKIMGVE